MKRWLVVALTILGWGCSLGAQAFAQVVDATVCDVVKKPAAFDGKMVRIKGTVVAGFDEFAIKGVADPNCGFPVNVIWLSYPPGSKGKAGPAAMVQIQPAHNFSGTYTAPTRTPVALEKNKDFKQFDSLLAQTHQKGADMCLGCARYQVSATFVGRLDGVADATLKRDASGKIVGFGGFGNMNAYPARLVLQTVSDIASKEIDYSKHDQAIKFDAPPPAFGSGDMPVGGVDLNTAIAHALQSAQAVASGQVKDQAVKAAQVFGKSSEHTGVVASLGVANEAGSNEALSTKDSLDGVQFNCTFNEDRLHGEALTRAVTYLGEHVSELRNPAPGNEDAPLYVFESDAWIVTAITSLVSGQKYLTLPGGYLLWDASWAVASRDDMMESALKDFLSNEAMLSK
jgi:hypothetical protein